MGMFGWEVATIPSKIQLTALICFGIVCVACFTMLAYPIVKMWTGVK